LWRDSQSHPSAWVWVSTFRGAETDFAGYGGDQPGGLGGSGAGGGRRRLISVSFRGTYPLVLYMRLPPIERDPAAAESGVAVVGFRVGMAHYRVYLLNETDRIFDWPAVDRDSDDAAILAAARHGVRSPAVEIWTGARKVVHLTAAELDSRHH